jgi:hypothetical protein
MALLLGLFFVVALPGVASANHSWGGYHWARTSNPFTLKLGDNVSSQWDSILGTTSSDWSVSTVLDTSIVTGQAVKRLCSATAGRDEICNGRYGQNGWLGVASIWVSGLHITQGTVKVNDTYFSMSQYNTTAWRNLVMCQEVGHTLGLDHQDTTFDNLNLGTCMDYTNNPTGGGLNGTLDNQQPNQGDYDELRCIYEYPTVTLSTSTHACTGTGTGHLDTTTTVGQPTPTGAAAESRSGWGREVARLNGGHTSVFVRDLGAGQQIITFVIWA